MGFRGGDQRKKATEDQELWNLAEIRLQVRDPQHVQGVQRPQCEGCHHQVLQGWGPGTEPGHTPFRSSGVRLSRPVNAAVLWSPRCTTARSSSLCLAESKSKEVV